MDQQNNISKIRQEYQSSRLSRNDLTENPFNFFHKWIDEAMKARIPEPTAMNLATVSYDGQPSSRIVLLKEITNECICFFTNYNSRKAIQIEQNNKAAVNFFWPLLERQIRIEGLIYKCDPELSEIYFKSRPYESQLGAWASPQSQVIENREELLSRYEKIKHQYINPDSVPKPPHWGGYSLKPHLFEFWQGRSGRLHDRFQYLKEDTRWIIQRLAP